VESNEGALHSWRTVDICFYKKGVDSCIILRFLFEMKNWQRRRNILYSRPAA